MDDKKTVVKDFSSSPKLASGSGGIARFAPAMFIITMLVLGVLSGLFIERQTNSATNSESKTKVIQSESLVGSADRDAFPDSVTGILRDGGVDGEGTHHLEREGGPSQNVYLTSSVLDMSQFVDQEVTVWGETYSAQKAGWLMDVGLLELKE